MSAFSPFPACCSGVHLFLAMFSQYFMWNPARCGVGAGVQGASPSMFCIMAVGIKHSRYVALAASAWSALTLRHSGLW